MDNGAWWATSIARQAVCGTRGSLQTMHGGGSGPSCCAFPHRVAFTGFLSVSDCDRRVPAEFGQESQASSCVEEWRGPDPSSKATLWVKAQHEGALPPPCIVRKDPRVPHTARRGA